MKDIWNIKFDWTLNGDTWLREERLDAYWSGVTYIPDNYFKYQKCLSGITYQYVNTLDDIYNKNPMVGKNWCIYNMYNEFDIINNFMVNMDSVDVCSTSSLDLTLRYYTIDNAYLKTKHKVLLVNQSDKTQNGLYNVDQRGFLIRSDFMADSGNTFRYKGYVKLGDNKHKEYHLKNVGDYFPVSYQSADYMSGKTYIIKNFFNYNLGATIPIPKLIFTDYDIARHMNPLNYSLYTGFNVSNVLNNGDKVVIKYHDNEYIIILDPDTTKFIYTGITSGSTMFNKYDEWWLTATNESVYTFVKVSSNFYSNTNLNDYVQIEISGNTSLFYNTFIKSKDNSVDYYVSLKDPIPNNLLTDLSGYSYTITNLQWSTIGNIQTILNSAYHSKYFYVDPSLNVSPTYYQYNHYFDYDGLQIIYSGVSYTEYSFSTTNSYSKYKLYEHLNSINPTIFNNSYSFLSDVNLTLFTSGLTAFNEIQSSEYLGMYPKGTYVKITPTNPSDMYFLKNHTFVNLNSIYKTLIVDYVPNEYFIIETYKSNSGLTITSIDSIYTLTGISELLYSVYKNEENDWYRVKDDDLRKDICISYSRIIENDINITKNTTALLTQDDNHKFVLEMYNPENLMNNGGNITFSYDPNLIYKPIELIEIGVDKHTKIPIPILSENLVITYDLLTGATSGSTTGTTAYGSFSFKIKATIGMVFNYILQSISPTTLDIDWGDGLETITFNGYYIGSHTYSANNFFGITFQGDLQYLRSVTVNGGGIFISNVMNINNLTSLTLSNNILPDFDITGLLYLTHLDLSNNNLVDVDKFFNILDSNGLLNGYINTSGMGIAGLNAHVTTISQVSRNNLILKGWTLVYD